MTEKVQKVDGLDKAESGTCCGEVAERCKNRFEGMTMKKMREHLFALGASVVLTLSVVLAQDQAPVMAPPPGGGPQPDAVQPAPAAAPAVAAPAAAKPAATALKPTPVPSRRTTSPLVRRPAAALPGAARPATMTPTPAASAAADADASGESKEPKAKTTTPALKFDNAPADIILQAFAQETGKTLLMAPDVPKANITLKSQPDMQLTKDEYIEAIEVVLSMNGIVLEPFGEKFVKVLARKTVRTDGIKIVMEPPEGGHPEKTRTVSQMIQFKSITVAEAQKALEGFKKPDGMMQTFERTNSLLVTDTQENVNRMLEIVKFIDQPLVATEEVNVRQIRFAKAEDIKKRLEELVAESQKQTQAKEEIKANTSGAPGITRTMGSSSSLSTRPLPPGLTRLGSTQQTAPVTPNETLETLVSDADRGMIRGKVQIIADERTNQLIIITRADNLAFFERIITVLDIETTPDVKVEVQRLEFADAEEVSTMLNDLIGNATSKKDDKSAANKGSNKSATKSGATPSAAPSSTPPGGASDQAARSTSLAEAVAARANRSNEASSGDSAQSKLGQLSKENIKILADKRTNAIVMMGSLGDLAAVREIVKSMDIQLSQVMIETVMLQVTLGDTLKTGIDWVRRVKTAKTTTTYDANGNAVKTTGTDYLYGLGGGGGSTKVAQDLFGVVTNLAVTSGSAGVEYMATIKGLNLDAIISASQEDSRTKVLSSPVLLTVDNKEATIEATDLKYMYKGMRYMGYSSTSGGGSYEPDIEQRDVGTTVKVTPRISPSGNVVLSVEEKFEDAIDNGQTINGQSWPTVMTRKLSADVSVGNGETVILGGLVKTTKSNGESGIPILKDIPYIGKYLFGSVSSSETRSELLVFLTPYVIESQKDMDREARRRKDYVNATDIWTKGWSDSKLADPVSASEMKERLARKKEMEKAWREYREKLEQSQEVDERVNQERAKTESLLQTDHPKKPQPIGTLKVEQSVEVLKPKDGTDAPAVSMEGAGGEKPIQPAIEQPSKPWWKIL